MLSTITDEGVPPVHTQYPFFCWNGAKSHFRFHAPTSSWNVDAEPGTTNLDVLPGMTTLKQRSLAWQPDTVVARRAQKERHAEWRPSSCLSSDKPSRSMNALSTIAQKMHGHTVDADHPFAWTRNEIVGKKMGLRSAFGLVAELLSHGAETSRRFSIAS